MDAEEKTQNGSEPPAKVIVHFLYYFCNAKHQTVDCCHKTATRLFIIPKYPCTSLTENTFCQSFWAIFECYALLFQDSVPCTFKFLRFSRSGAPKSRWYHSLKIQSDFVTSCFGMNSKFILVPTAHLAASAMEDIQKYHKTGLFYMVTLFAQFLTREMHLIITAD